MELVGVFVVADEEHVAHQRVETVAQPDVALLGASLEGCLDLLLSVELGTHTVVAFPLGLHILLANFLCALVEHAVEHPVGDERSGEQVFLPVQSVAFYLLAAHAECRREVAEQSVYGCCRNFPDAEEAQHVVDAVCVEVLLHILEAANPPLAAVGYHLVPVVCGEAPVLSAHREVIWRSTGLSVEVEVAGL